MWLRTQALELWLNAQSRRGWSVAAMDGSELRLRKGGGKRHCIVAHANKERPNFIRRCRADGWLLAGSGDGTLIFEDAEGTAQALDPAATEDYVRRRNRRRAFISVASGTAILLSFVVWRLCGSDFTVMRDAANGFLSAGRHARHAGAGPCLPLAQAARPAWTG